MNWTAEKYFMDRLNARSGRKSDEQQGATVNDSLSLKTWELLFIMIVSRTMDGMDCSKQHDTSYLKRYVKTFLPVVPDEITIRELTTVVDVSWRSRPDLEEFSVVELPHSFHGQVGDKTWLLYDCEDPVAQTRLLDGKDGTKVDLSAFGIVQCTLIEDKLEQHRREKLVKIGQFLSFQDFPKYFHCHGDWKTFLQTKGVATSSSQELDYHRSTPNFHYIGWNYNAPNFDFDGSFFFKVTNHWYSAFWIPQSARSSDCLAFLALAPPEDAHLMGLDNSED